MAAQADNGFDTARVGQMTKSDTGGRKHGRFLFTLEQVQKSGHTLVRKRAVRYSELPQNICPQGALFRARAGAERTGSVQHIPRGPKVQQDDKLPPRLLR